MRDLCICFVHLVFYMKDTPHGKRSLRSYLHETVWHVFHWTDFYITKLVVRVADVIIASMNTYQKLCNHMPHLIFW